jgi:hypothetical protein
MNTPIINIFVDNQFVRIFQQMGQVMKCMRITEKLKDLTV